MEKVMGYRCKWIDGDFAAFINFEMRFRQIAAAVVTALVVAGASVACKPTTPAVPASHVAAASQNTVLATSSSATKVQEGRQQTAESAGAETWVSKDCGPAQMSLRCSAAEPDCTRTSLSLKNSHGQRIDINPPVELAEFTAVGIDCVIARNGVRYFVVQYGERPYGCKFCEWYEMYDISGNLLTHSVPPILVGKAHSGADQQMPNNDEFEALADQMGINEVNIELLGRP
jgi:hypothetical protein